MTTLSEWDIDLHLRGRVRFGVGVIASLPELVREAGGERIFLVTDPGVVRSGVVGQVVDVELLGLGHPCAIHLALDERPFPDVVEPDGLGRVEHLG